MEKFKLTKKSVWYEQYLLNGRSLKCEDLAYGKGKCKNKGSHLLRLTGRILNINRFFFVCDKHFNSGLKRFEYTDELRIVRKERFELNRENKLKSNSVCFH